MRTADADILVVPGLGGSGPDHWQSRWQAKLSTARRVEQADWDAPDLVLWTDAVVAAVAAATRPVVIIAHSLGVPTVVHATPRFPAGSVRGAMLVAPPDVERPDMPAAIDPAYAPLPREPLTYPSLLCASRDDPYCAYERAEDLGYAWGSAIVDAGLSGHINTDSGHGPWPEGLLQLAAFLRPL